MGSCYKCKKEVTLKEDETTCDNCQTLLKYVCNECHKPFLVLNKQTREKLVECKICGFFECPNCGACSPTCDIHEWRKEINKILISPVLFFEKTNRLIELIKSIKITVDRKKCPYGVSISYAKGKIKTIYVKMNGFKTKNNFDVEAFKKKYADIEKLNIGTTLKVDDIRENGTYGQEYRDALNLSICSGRIKVEYKKNQQGIEYAIYTRIVGKSCEKLDLQNLIIAQCPICKKVFSRTADLCDTCLHKNKSKNHNKGDRVRLQIKISNKDACQLQRSLFIKEMKK